MRRGIGVGILLGALVSCKPQVSSHKPAVRHPPKESGAAVQVVKGLTLDSYKGLFLVWRLRSPQAERYPVEERIELARPEVQFYEQGRKSSFLSAGRGRLFNTSQDLLAWDGVVLISTDGMKLVGDVVRYDGKLQHITSTAPVTVTRGRSVARGVGWEASPDLSHIVIFNQETEWVEGESLRRRHE